MSATPPTMVRATAADLPHVVDLLVQAFDRDPLVTYICRDDARRADAVRTFFTMSSRMSLANGMLFMTPDRSCVLTGARPGQQRMHPVKRMLALPIFARMTGWRRLGKVMGALSELQSWHPTEPHYYFIHLATDPSRRSAGVATRLHEEALEEVDRAGLLAYGETSVVERIPFYKRLGFDVIGERHLAGDGPRVISLLRKPQPVRNPS